MAKETVGCSGGLNAAAFYQSVVSNAGEPEYLIYFHIRNKELLHKTSNA
jgi:hypothetical protein